MEDTTAADKEHIKNIAAGFAGAGGEITMSTMLFASACNHAGVDTEDVPHSLEGDVATVPAAEFCKLAAAVTGPDTETERPPVAKPRTRQRRAKKRVSTAE